MFCRNKLRHFSDFTPHLPFQFHGFCDIHPMYKMAILLITVLVLASCKSTTDRQWVVINNSSTEIIVQFDGEMESYSAETTVAAGERETIGLESTEAGEAAGSPTTKITDMLILNSTDSATKDFRLDSNWAVRQEDGSNSSTTFIFSFELTDADF